MLIIDCGSVIGWTISWVNIPGTIFASSESRE
jgi:hypothetical protein